jgi:hypothetical protein
MHQSTKGKKWDKEGTGRGKTYGIPSLLPDRVHDSALSDNSPNTWSFSLLTHRSLAQSEIEDQLITPRLIRIDQRPNEILNGLNEVVTRDQVEDNVEGEHGTTAGQIVHVG